MARRKPLARGGAGMIRPTFGDRLAHDITNRASVRDAILAVDVPTIVGKVKWGSGPVKNVAKTPLVGGQWQHGLQLHHFQRNRERDRTHRQRSIESGRKPGRHPYCRSLFHFAQYSHPVQWQSHLDRRGTGYVREYRQRECNRNGQQCRAANRQHHQPSERQHRFRRCNFCRYGQWDCPNRQRSIEG